MSSLPFLFPLLLFPCFGHTSWFWGLGHVPVAAEGMPLPDARGGDQPLHTGNLQLQKFWRQRKHRVTSRYTCRETMLSSHVLKQGQGRVIGSHERLQLCEPRSPDHFPRLKTWSFCSLKQCPLWDQKELTL